MTSRQQENNINHIALVLDGSGSMSGHRETLPQVIDALIKQLAEQSQQLNQETRITTYVFDNTVTCTVYDKDVLRLPAGKELYHVPGGMTALVDATWKALDDLEKTAQLYGDHAFLVYVLTDGHENASRYHVASALGARLRGLPDNWTIGALVPDFPSMQLAKQWGFPAGNVAVWSTTSATGATEVGEVIKQATASYMTARSTGTRSTKNLFDTSHVNAATVASSGMKPLDTSQYQIIPVPVSALDQKNKKEEPVVEIARFVEKCGHKYITGRTYYELFERSRIQGDKDVAVVENKTNKVFTGPQARKLVNLPDYEVRIAPSKNPDYTIFIQSTSLNRHLKPYQKVLLLT